MKVAAYVGFALKQEASQSATDVNIANKLVVKIV